VIKFFEIILCVDGHDSERLQLSVLRPVYTSRRIRRVSPTRVKYTRVYKNNNNIYKRAVQIPRVHMLARDICSCWLPFSVHTHIIRVWYIIYYYVIRRSVMRGFSEGESRNQKTNYGAANGDGEMAIPKFMRYIRVFYTSCMLQVLE